MRSGWVWLLLCFVFWPWEGLVLVHRGQRVERLEP